MNILYNQVFSSTEVDLHGDLISEEELQLLFNEIPESSMMCSEHNPGNRPFAKSFNKRLERIKSGNLAIVCDVEIYDEAEMKKCGGYSISFIRRTYTAYRDQKPDVHIRYNPRIFDTKEIHDLVHLSTSNQKLNASELYQKALDIPLIIFVVFASAGIANGFFNAMGADLYGAIKKYLSLAGKKIRDKHKADLTCQFSFVATELKNQPDILVSISSTMIDQLAAIGVSVDMILQELQKHYDLGEVCRASLTLLDDSPTWRVEYIMDARDNIPHATDENET